MHALRRIALGRLWPRHVGGAAAVEFALVFPAFIVLILGIMDTGRLYRVWHTVHFAVAEAARCASINPTVCGTSAQIAAYAAVETMGLSLPTGVTATQIFTVTTTTCGTKVTAAWPFQYVAVGFFPYSGTVTASACEVKGL
jgi:Flp pilus assembly protein TadG